MKKQIIMIIIISLSLLLSCHGTNMPNFTQSKSTPTKTVTQSLISTQTPLNTTTMIDPLPSASETLKITNTPMAIKTTLPYSTQTTQQAGNMNTQCLPVSPTFTSDTDLSGVIVLGTRAGAEQRRYDTLLLNMDTGKKTEFTTPEVYQVENVVSPDRKMMAYESVIFDTSDTLPKKELVIANSDGTRLKTIAWEEKWRDIMEWTADQRLLLSYDEPYLTSDGQTIPVSYMVIDPFTGKQELLQPDVPEFLDLYPITLSIWQGLIYDPTLTRVIYPRLIPDSNEIYTYVLWNVTEEKVVTSLDNIYQNFVSFKNTTPTPIWSPDGSQFAFKGQIYVSDELVKFEMYLVSRDGTIEQLTNLTSISEIEPYRFSWSPDGKHIAILIDAWYTHGNTHLAVIDVDNHHVTDYCVPVRGLELGVSIYITPIWSPNGSQLLVMDDTEEYRHVIIVDIFKNYAAQIAENYDPLGWMVAP